MGRWAAWGAAVLVATACSTPQEDPAPESGPASSPPASTSSPSPSPEPTTGPSGSAPTRPRPPIGPRALEVSVATDAVRHLAGTIGPRHGTGPAFREAVTWVAGEMRRLDYRVERRRFDVPGGVSWGVPVPAGPSTNVVATPRGFDATRPHLVVGAHLDTVPQAPGAEDNASGVGVLLAAASAAAKARTRLPVVWVAFGAEEPRGPTDDDHHYGSRAYVAQMRPAERRAMRAMVSLDRVGVGTVVPVGSAGDRDPVQQQLLAAAGRADVAAVADPSSRSSDHWSFVRDGLPAARLGSTPYAGYHSPDDVPAVVQPAQLKRTGRIVLAWLSPSG